MENDRYKAIIQRALDDLYAAAGELEEAPFLPQIRPFVVLPGIVWPYNDELTKLWVPGRFRYEHTRDTASCAIPTVRYVNHASRVIMQCCPTPRHVFRALQRIRAATAWCRAKLTEAGNGK